jgi:hypothetical protein
MGIEHTSSPLSTPEAWPSGALLRRPIGRVAVVTDSVAQVPPEAADRWGISVVPLVVTIETERYLDGIDLAGSNLGRLHRHGGGSRRGRRQAIGCSRAVRP